MYELVHFHVRFLRGNLQGVFMVLFVPGVTLRDSFLDVFITSDTVVNGEPSCGI